MTILFFSRLVLYLFAFLLPVIHPAVAVSYDAVGWCLWFFLIPAEMLVAHFAAPPRRSAKQWLALGGLTLVAAEVFIVFKTGFSGMALLALALGLASFLITALIFRGGERWASVAVLEQFFLAWLYYRMLNFSRADEEVAARSAGLAQLILVGSLVALLAHGVILYLSLYRGTGRRGAKEIALFAGLAAPLLLLVILVLPPDFVKNSQIANQLSGEPDPQLVPLDGTTNGLDNGNLRSPLEGEGDPGGRTGEQGDQGEQGPQLEGLPAEQWSEGMGEGQGQGQGQNQGANQGDTQGDNQGEGEGEGEDRQYAVMVVASPRSPVYAATAYRGVLDPVAGFGLTPDEPLNDLTYRRLLETWVDADPPLDAQREDLPIFTLSTIPDRTLAYRPSRVEPTVLNRQYHPLDYSFTAISSVSSATPEEWVDVPELLPETRASLAEYLDADLSPEDRAVFRTFLDTALTGGTGGYFERIYSILRSFSTYQYEIGYEEDVSVGKMVQFLTATRTGDCTEFSNTAGILGRLAGIPSRVVVGYLASQDLQTDAHRQGLFVLRQMIEPLQRFDPEDLYLVTNAHRHSWVQFYLPGYGWVDFDPTSFALPPVGSGDANNRNVVIPIITPEPNPREFRPFPWLALLKGLGIAAGGLVVALYLFRYGREALLLVRSRSGGLRGLRATERLLYMRLAADGYTIKHPWETPIEYAERLPETRVFATLYTELRYRDPTSGNGRENGLRPVYHQTLARCRRPGLGAALRRGFSLRPLRY